MILRFDRKSRPFDEPESPNAAIATNVRNLLDQVIGEDHGRQTRNGFNDLGFYMNLCAQDGSPDAELSSVDIHHNDSFCFGIQAVYRSKFSNGDITSTAPLHLYRRGHYSRRGDNRRTSRITFENGEHLAEIRTRQGEITDQIAFLTNRRTYSFGGSGGDGEDMSITADLTQRIVAFAGTSNGVLECLGAISISNGGVDRLVGLPTAVVLRERHRTKMILRFDWKSFSFTEPESPRSPIATRVEHLLNQVVGRNHGRKTRNGFNDLSFYMNLCAQDGSPYVDICAVDIHHNDSFCFGIQAVYRSTCSNGDIDRLPAPIHVYERGYYANEGGHHQVERLVFHRGEYLAEIRTRQGEITDQIAFLTNRRTVTYGGSGGSGEYMSPVDHSRRIVAFAGTSNGILECLGAISVSRNWEVVGPIVLLRTLVEQRRASRVVGADPLAKDDAVTQTLIMDVSEDVFQRTLSFLVQGIEISD